MDQGFDCIGGRQHGLITSRQLASIGWSKPKIRGAVRRRRLIPVRLGVYRLAGAPVTRRQAWLAAVLAAGEGALVSHGTACELWAFRGFRPPEGIDVLVSGRDAPKIEGVIGHETKLLPDGHRSVYDWIPATSPERTIVDSCGLFSPSGLGSAVNDGLRRSLVLLPRLARTVDDVPISGRRPIVPIVDVLRHRIPGYDPGDSDPEVDLVDVLVRAGLPRPRLGIKVVAEGHTMFVDVGWPDVQVGFEYDSVDFHIHAFHEDRARLRRLKRAGWDIWPVTSTTPKNEILAIATLAFPGRATANSVDIRKSGLG